MNTRRNLFQILVALVLTAQIATAQHEHGDAPTDAHEHHNHPHEHGDGHAHLTAGLRAAGASEKQAEQIVELHHRLMLGAVDLRANVEKAEIRLAMAIHAKDVEEEAVQDRVQSLFAARAKLASHHIGGMFEARRILGDPLWKKLGPHLHDQHRAIARALGLERMIHKAHGHDAEPHSHEHEHEHEHEHTAEHEHDRAHGHK